MSPIEIEDARRAPGVTPQACGLLWSAHTQADKALLRTFDNAVWRASVVLKGESLTAKQLADRRGWSVSYARKVLRVCRHFGFVQQVGRYTYTWRKSYEPLAA